MFPLDPPPPPYGASATKPPAASSDLANVIDQLWQIRPPGPDNLLRHPAFRSLYQVCNTTYPQAGSGIGLEIALDRALRGYGMPCRASSRTASLTPEDAAIALDRAFHLENETRIHLCPLNLLDDIPLLQFGPCTIKSIQTEELAEVVDALRLRRHYGDVLELGKLAQFTWMMVNETVPIDTAVADRALPFLCTSIEADLGQVFPHQGSFPAVVENVLFFLLLAPWEDWSTMTDVNWAGFEIPWVYSITNDVFRHVSPPPTANTLCWQPHVFVTTEGEEIETELPTQIALASNASVLVPRLFTEEHWQTLQRAQQSALFTTPVAHFLVRGFQTVGMDEFLAHMTCIEAAVGLRSDYNGTGKNKNPRRKGSSTDQIVRRIATLLGSAADGEDYRNLFEIRCAYLHGRSVSPLSTSARMKARQLARRVAHALVHATQTIAGPIDRENFLQEL